ncbi:MAG: FKBP-type peptidyl-prolyl cis-trans isomerase [Saprospiraceae bacterium]|jgi:FKBP-type peptidyl-prolyl cis-trans isomerase FklB|nr:FKBP-type peptidyl-prolyl cis-trans isomerase [Saprospiraceae bacterium]
MKKNAIYLIIAVVMSANLAIAQNKEGNKMDSLSYAIGVLIGQNIKSQGVDKIVSADLAKALDDVFSGGKLAMDQGQANQVFSEYMTAKNKKSGASQLEEGQKFLEENKKRPEVKTTASGLQYEVLKATEGPKPKATDKVTVHYKGTLLNGQTFDSSYDRGETIEFPLNGVIKGWTEGVQLMSVGSKYKFFIPHNLAYGEQGAGGSIKPFSTLVFEVELFKIN